MKLISSGLKDNHLADKMDASNQIIGLPIDYFTGVLEYSYITESHQTVGY